MFPFDMFGQGVPPDGGMGYPGADMSGMMGPMGGGMPGMGMDMGGMGGYPMQAPMPGYPVAGNYPGAMPYSGQMLGRFDYSGYVKYSRAQMLDGLRNYVVMCNNGKVPISKEEKLEETPQFLRHACAECGVSHLQMLTFNIPEAGIQIPFYFCTACGKLFYYKDFAV